MAEFRFGVLLDIALYLVPVSLIITYFLAEGANRQKTAKLLDLGEHLFELGYQNLLLALGFNPLGNIETNTRQILDSLEGKGRESISRSFS